MPRGESAQNAPAGRQLVHVQQVEQSILHLRGQKVLLDSDLAKIYGTSVGRLNEAVKRNRSRFPPDFMFQLTSEEAAALRYQIGASKEGRGGRRYRPYAFTEHGVAMLSSVLRSRAGEHCDYARIRPPARDADVERQPGA